MNKNIDFFSVMLYFISFVLATKSSVEKEAKLFVLNQYYSRPMFFKIFGLQPTLLIPRISQPPEHDTTHSTYTTPH